MSDLNDPQKALVHPLLGGHAHRMVEMYLNGDRIVAIFEACGVPYTEHARRILEQARRALGHPKRRKVGRVNPAWKGAQPRYRKGYKYVRVDDMEDRSGRAYWRPEHHIVMEQKLGRPLLKTEVVHHVDGDTRNNDPSNLEVFPSNGAHLAHTLAGKCPKWTLDGRQRILAGWSSRMKNPVARDDFLHPETNNHSLGQPDTVARNP